MAEREREREREREKKRETEGDREGKLPHRGKIRHGKVSSSFLDFFSFSV